MSDNKKKEDSLAEYRKKRKSQLSKAKKVKAGKHMSPRAKKIFWRTFWIAILVAIIALITILAVNGSGAVERGKTVVTVGNTDVSAAEYNYYYQTTINNFLNNYSSILSYMNLDTEKDYHDQMYDEENNVTWADFFNTQTVSSIQQVIALCEDAAENGCELEAADKDSVDQQIASLKSQAEENGWVFSQYLSTAYGKGTNKSVMRDVMLKYALAQKYTALKNEEFTPTDDEAIANYEANKKDFDFVSYRSYSTTGSITAAEGETLTDEQTAQNAEEAKTKADEFIAKVTDEASFNETARLIREAEIAEEKAASTADTTATDDTTAETTEPTNAYDDADATLKSEVTYSSASSTDAALADWLFDEARVAGDKTVIGNDSGSAIAVYYISRGHNEYNTVNVRHALAKFETTTDEDGNETVVDGAETAALEKANGWKDEWEAGDKTEDSFAELAKANSEDPVSAANAGLYENVYHDQMDENFDAWCFDESRQPGDTEIISTTYGYHYMYFVGESKPYYIIQSADAMANAEYETFITGLTEAREPAINDANLANYTVYGQK